MHIRIDSREAQQMVYASNNTSGFYLSVSVLKDLHLLPADFLAQIFQLNSVKITKKKALCTCPRREPILLMPCNIPYSSSETNRHLLEQSIRYHFKSRLLQESHRTLASPLMQHHPRFIPIPVSHH